MCSPTLRMREERKRVLLRGLRVVEVGVEEGEVEVEVGLREGGGGGGRLAGAVGARVDEGR